MRRIVLILLTLVVTSCTVEDDHIAEINAVLVDDSKNNLIIDIIYVSPSKPGIQTQPKIDEIRFINQLNSNFFHRHDIGFTLGDIKTIVNDELHDLRDNVNEEAHIFLKETKNIYKEDRLSVFIIKRSHTFGVAGIGKNQRVLLTDKKAFSSTAPHEIGHALGLYHISEVGNIMSFMQTVPRTDFNENQKNRMITKIDDINNTW